eukprot:TCONS_00015537-protein
MDEERRRERNKNAMIKSIEEINKLTKEVMFKTTEIKETIQMYQSSSPIDDDDSPNTEADSYRPDGEDKKALNKSIAQARRRIQDTVDQIKSTREGIRVEHIKRGELFKRLSDLKAKENEKKSHHLSTEDQYENKITVQKVKTVSGVTNYMGNNAKRRPRKNLLSPQDI